MYGKNGAQNRKAIKGWMVKARGEVMERMEQLESVNEQNYRDIVDTVLRGYRSAKNASPVELAAAAAELKSHWKSIQRSLKAAKPKKTQSSAGRGTAKSSAGKSGSTAKSRA